MVLEEATAVPDPNANEFLPPSDADPYASDSPSQQPTSIEIKLDDLPKPAPIIGPLTGFTRPRTIAVIQNALEGATKAVGRPLTKDEVEALSYAGARGVSITSYGIGLGSGLGLWRCYQTAGSFKFPLVKPGRLEIDPDKFGQWSGARARGAWHMVRGSVYVGLGALLGHVICTAIATSVVANSVGRDPRLKNLIQTTVGRIERREIARRQTAGGAPASTEQAGQAGQADRRRPFGRSSGSEDDMSPTTNSYPYPTASQGMDSGENAGQAYGQLRSGMPQNSSQGGEPNFTSGYDDDASPTAAVPVSGGGSAWDRIRREASTGSGAVRATAPGSRTPDALSQSARQRIQREQRDGSGVGSGFSYQKSGERGLAQGDAQKEFESRLERERRGENFSEDGKTW